MNNNHNPRTVEDVIKDFKDRRAGVLKALTKDVEEFYNLCDPNNPNLCLYGFPDQQWEVNLPPPSSDLPEPRLGINFARDTMSKHQWLSMVALHSDAWLYSVATYFANKFRFDKADKKRLFNRITDVPSISDVMEGKGRKRGRIEGGGLPEHVLDEEVLSRLPVRDLVKYRSVCQTWRCLIDGPNFVSAHLKNYKNNSEGSHLLVMFRAPRGWMGDEQVLIRRGDTFRKVQELKNSYASSNLVSYVNGLFLVKKGSFRSFREINLWNPSIEKSLDVPNTNYGALQDATFFEIGLGYDQSCNDYKVVAIIYPHAEIKYCFGERYRATVPGLVQVYTLSSNAWTSNLGVSPPPYWSVGKQVYFNGAIHWMNFGPNVSNESWDKSKDSYVVLFDVEIEVFKYFELPSGMRKDDEPQPKEKFPTVLGGSFAIFCSYSEARHDIWVMREYGVSNSWSKVYTFTLELENLLHLKRNGELLFAVVGKGIKSYDINKKKVKDLAKTYSRSSKYTIFTYVESLVLSKEGKIQGSSSSQ